MDSEMPHIMELLGRTRVVIENGLVVEVGDPKIDWCPVWDKAAAIPKFTKEEVRKNIEDRIQKFGMFTPKRKLEYDGKFVDFGVTEIMMTALRRGIIDSTVTVCDGAGTVITSNPELVQGMGAQMSGLIETEPIKEIIEGIEMRGGIILDKEKARIDQVEGFRKACDLGHKNIAVSLVGCRDAKRLRTMEKESNNNMILIGAHYTELNDIEAKGLMEMLDIITASASKIIRNIVKPILQAGTSVPMFALTQKGKELLCERAKYVETPIIMSTMRLPELPEHKQPRPLR